MNTFARRNIFATLATTLIFSSLAASAQAIQAASDSQLVASSTVASAESSSVLPDAPSTTAYMLTADSQPAPAAHVAPKYATTIASDETAQPLTAGGKVIMMGKDLYAPIHIASAVLGAGYSHVTNGSPNYGTDGGAFAQRFGADYLRATTERVFEKGVFSPILHTDSRYYVMGPGHNYARRGLYAVTRVLITKTDGGRSTINAPLILADAAGTGLAYEYYPAINQNFRDSAAEFGSSLLGSAIGFEVSEFSNDLLKLVHHKKK